MNENVKVEKVEALSIPNYKESKVYISNHVVEVVTVQKPSIAIKRFKRISKDACINEETGEYIPFNSKRRSSKTQRHFKRAANDLRRIINLNFFGDHSEKFITLTYRYKMKDYVKAAEDFRNFWYLFKYRYPNCEYIRILEPQGNGNWHLHILVKDTTSKELYIEVDMLKKLWSKGNVWIEDLPFADNFGAYFSVNFDDSDDEQGKKSTIKGKRVECYPANFKLYTCSKGIRKPQAISMPYGDIKEIVKGNQPCFSYTKNIVGEDDRLLNSITYEQFNLKRGKKHEFER